MTDRLTDIRHAGACVGGRVRVSRRRRKNERERKLNFNTRMYAGDFKAVSKMIEAVKEGKDLPPLNEVENDKRGKKVLLV